METYYTLLKSNWDTLLNSILNEYDIYAPFHFGESIEYSIVTESNVKNIIYNRPKPSTPLKTFFLPVKENVVNPSKSDKKRIVMGAPSCDLSALSILDEIYLDKDYIDPNYSGHRKNTLLIGFDCHSTLEHCHCTTYGFKPYPEENTDIVISYIEDKIVLNVKTEAGETFRKNWINSYERITEKELTKLNDIQTDVEKELNGKNADLPDYQQTGKLITASEEDIWQRYSDTCVSCGACSAICPTCSCFLFIERPQFEKVRSIDTCQYPGFERVAAGEDPLRPLSKRFRNRYMCKYVWKPEKFESKACTGCGRCIEACIGDINKNDLFRELNKKETVET
ncbi:MAG: 4Fe-4S dicluster domain-containing protein [Bacteroidales bacterium]|nr:4Fe-4S dicluster domain-containing protein [Bacteroidales bacterium]MCF8336348.1 4Fe-4S dicluster domain-containing protein [Bacteroidales bacterium]